MLGTRGFSGLTSSPFLETSYIRCIWTLTVLAAFTIVSSPSGLSEAGGMIVTNLTTHINSRGLFIFPGVQVSLITMLSSFLFRLVLSSSLWHSPPASVFFLVSSIDFTFSFVSLTRFFQPMGFGPQEPYLFSTSPPGTGCRDPPLLPFLLPPSLYSWSTSSFGSL